MKHIFSEFVGNLLNSVELLSGFVGLYFHWKSFSNFCAANYTPTTQLYGDNIFPG